MSDVMIRSEPVTATPFSGRDASVRLSPPLARYSLRARKAADLQAACGLVVPDKIGTQRDGIICLGPDEWLLLAQDGTALSCQENAAVSVTDVSHRNVGLVVEGPRATEILSAGCPLDLDHFEIGCATRTIFETVEIILIREAADRFHVEVWRSFAPWLWTAFVTAASE